MIDDSISFSGNESMTIQTLIRELADSFTYEFWVKPSGETRLDVESSYGIYGNKGQKYLIGPGCGEHINEAGIGISIGTNGIAVYEHTIDHLPAVLVHPAYLKRWMHVALVYQNKVPFLYLNGQLIKKGSVSSKSKVYPSAIFGGYSPYGFFQGEAGEFRIWDHARSQEQIGLNMHASLTGDEAGLYWYTNHKSGITVHRGLKRTLDVSLVLPSYNRYPYNLLTLYSLQNQSYDLTKVEVIMVDNESSDLTPSIVHTHNFPFLFKYIKCEKNVGRPRSRNMGIKAAAGKIIIFLDAEVLVESDFIEQHVLTHQDQERRVAIGTIHLRGVYSLIHPGFNAEQIKHMNGLMNKDQRNWYEKWEAYTSNPKIVPLFNADDIKNQKFRSVSFTKLHEEYFQKEVLRHYGDHFSGFAFPWIFFFTGNISLRRSLLNQAGYFEEWNGYGWDDVEMGYRLFKMGASFLNLSEMITYHQEHPISTSIVEEAHLNFNKFQKKYREMDVQIFALNLIPHGKTLYQLNQIMIQYTTLCQEYKGDFKLFKQTFVSLLDRASYLLANKMKVTKLLPQSDPSYKKIMKEKNKISRLGKFHELLDGFETLCCL
ncbi:glycosyltransferase [Paenibacillus sedimenti]|uniref:Glycosyltransferase n=1 Tax=Paenibacillus sedimenti TaxID=2770274 RepID=A0A926KTB2_9BACL|nr:glycosyltransferase [Paenibacillus sedimenti]MBD0381605.1 glycosyltransferase [Paenibacillus sedimenti]